MMFRPSATLAAVAALSVSFAGCGYHLGENAQPPFSSITVEAVKNDSFAPQMQAEIHRQLADALAQEKSLHVVSSGGQGRLAVTLTEFKRDVAAVNPSDTVSAASYTLTLTARATLTDARTGKVLFKDRVFRATLPAYAQSGFNRTEYQSLPLLSRELAKKIDASIVGAW